MRLEGDQEPIKEYSHYSHDKIESNAARFRSRMSISLKKLEEMSTGNEFLKKTFYDMVLYCLRYTEDVFIMDRLNEIPVSSRDENWRNEYETTDARRRTLHDATIDSINIFSRTLREYGKSNEWLREVAKNGRPGYAGFAIALALEYYLSLEGNDNE
ncbi:DUF3232 domain-containing protein [Candidatus Nomurabacteria bacterium]|nr:DUF3232 domain-containing protein [Candidatus Nomurabacteria bacterium]